MGYTLLENVKIQLHQYHMDNNSIVFDNLEENPILEQLISNATDSVKKVRHYPSSWTDEKISEDMKQFNDVVVRLTIYDYNKEGMEFENTHTESGVTRQFSARAKVMGDILPFVDMF